MGMPGLGVMLHELSGGSANSADKYYGKKIIDAKMGESPDDYNSCGNKDRGSLLLSFEGGPTIRIWDDGQSCCEVRYVTTDDDPKTLIGQVLTAIEVRPVGTEKERTWDDEHETVFIDVKTDLGVGVTLCCHNEHNGYYGGFGLTITEEKS